MEAANEYAESALGETTYELTKFGRINQHNATTTVPIAIISIGIELVNKRRRVSVSLYYVCHFAFD